ncbi:MAG TPA: hypothetical protein DHW82_00825 [Spirochaetia bacterium]|nr:MAG: hypothetical protein A2Y41_10230 [Spirochaetes bacterium GWB1_36_13]HCL55541.1 hypothetical protein [Spirochaetia bacterium]
MVFQSLKLKDLKSFSADFSSRSKTGIELALDNNDFYHFEESELIYLKKTAEKNQFFFASFHAPFHDLNLASSDENLRAYAVRKVNTAISLASRLNVRKVIFHTGINPLVPEKKKEEICQRFFQSLEVLSNEAFKKNVVLFVENTYEKDFYYFEKMFHSFPELKLVLDIGHSYCFSNKKADEWIENFSEKIEHCHLHDNLLIEDSHLSLGEGKIPFHKILPLLPEKATLTLETPFKDLEKNLKFLSEHSLLKESVLS